MTTFREFLESTEEEDNVQQMLNKIPKKHAALMKGFHFKFQAGNTLDGDDDHVGLIKGKTVTVAAPWNYAREFTTLHEIAHMVFEKLVDDHWKKEWSKVVKKHKGRQKDQPDEELFCHAYANHFVKHKNLTHHHPEWAKYMDRLCRATG